MEQTDSSNITAQSHLQYLAKKGKKVALLDDAPKFPAVAAHIWHWFRRLSATRGGGFGPAPITFQEIDAMVRLLRITPEPWEVDMIGMLDGIWFDVVMERDKNKRGGKDKPKK